MGELRTRTIFADHRFTIVAVESVACRHGGAACGHHLTVSLKPVAVVVKEPDRTYAVDMEAKPVSIDVDQPGLRQLRIANGNAPE